MLIAIGFYLLIAFKGVIVMPTMSSPVHVSSLHEPKTERKFPTPDPRPNPLSPPGYLYATIRAQAPLSVETIIAEEDASKASETRRMYRHYRCERRGCLENPQTSRASSVAYERITR